MRRLEVLKKVALEAPDVRHGNILQQVVDHRVNDGHLELYGDGGVAALLQDFNDASALLEPCLGVVVQVGAELGEARQFAVLRIEQLQGAGDLLHGLGLCVAADA